MTADEKANDSALFGHLKEAEGKERFLTLTARTDGCCLWRGTGPLSEKFQSGGIRIRLP